MQNVVMYVNASSTLGTIRDYANAANANAPIFTLGFGVTLKIRLFKNKDDNTAYPISLFSGVTSWSAVFDTDFSQTTTPLVFADNSSIAVATVTETIDGTEYTFTELTVPISDLNTAALVAKIGTAESLSGLNAEIVGYDSSADAVFGLQIKGFSVRNRIYATGTPTVIEPDYLTAEQTRAMIAAGVVMQYSVDGSTSWHDTQADADRYLRFRSASSASATWSNAVKIPDTVESDPVYTAEKSTLALKTDLDDYVEKETGKGLSTNDYTTAEKTKLAGMAEGAEVNVQADWDESDATSDAYIQNKPTIPTVNNSTITFTQDGTTKGSFTLNQSTAATVALDTVTVDQTIISGSTNAVSGGAVYTAIGNVETLLATIIGA